MLSKCNKNVGYKVKTQKSIVFLYILEKDNWKMKFQLTIYNSIKTHDLCRINSAVCVPDLYTENYKALLKEIIFKNPKWKCIQYSYTVESISLRCQLS